MSLGNQWTKNIGACLGRPCRTEDESEDLPVLYEKSPSGLRGWIDIQFFRKKYARKANNVRACPVYAGLL